MAKLNNDLTEIITARNDMKSALASKGQTVTNDIRTYAEAISNIEGGSGDIQLYNSIVTMEADQTQSEGMYGTVYGREEGPITEDAEFQQVKFPASVTVSSEVTDSISASFRATGGGWTDMYVSVNATGASVEIMGMDFMSIAYTSSDGIHYTRTSETETYDIGTTMKFQGYSEWDSRIGQFVLTSVPVYNGLYQYIDYDDNEQIHFIPASAIEITGSDSSTVFTWNGSYDSTIYNIKKIREFCEEISNTEYSSDIISALLSVDTNDNLILIFGKRDNTTGYFEYPYYTYNQTNNNYELVISSSYSYTLDVYDIDISSDVYTYTKRSSITPYSTSGNAKFYNLECKMFPLRFAGSEMSNNIYYAIPSIVGLKYSSTYTTKTLQNFPGTAGCNLVYLKWQICPTQFTLIQPGSLYEGEVAFGKTGTVVGTLGVDPSDTFDDAAANICVKTQDAYDDMTPLVATDSDKTAGLGKNIVFIPSKRDGTPLLDTSNLTSAYDMFNSCEKLVSVATLDIHNATSTEKMFYRCLNLLAIPQLDTSNSTNMRQMFYGCTSLTTLPLLDTGSVTDMEEMCNGCTGLTAIPLLDTSHVTKMNFTFMSCTNLLSIPLLDTSAATDLRYTFSGCSNLVSVPTLNTSNATNMNNMFAVCSSLSDASLNNILAMCTNANSYTSTKTLKYIGLSSEQATRCQSLSNYQAFTNAGWTTGY